MAGAVWRAFNPAGGESREEEALVTARQEGYYLCLHRRPMTPAKMYRLIQRRLPNVPLAPALRGCREAQRR